MKGSFAKAFFIAEAMALLVNWFYWTLSFLFLAKVIKEEKEQFSFTQSAMSFVKVLVLFSGIVLSTWAISFLSTYIFRMPIPMINYNLVWVAIPLLIYSVGFFALKQPELFRVVLQEKPKTKVRELMNENEITQLRSQLTRVMQDEKVYLDNELTLSDLSKRLNTSTNNLSWLLNTIYQSNFYDFVNEYRIKAFVSKLERKEHKAKTLFSLSMEVGIQFQIYLQ